MSHKNQKPQWWQLYVGLPALVGLFLPETRAALTEMEHVLAEFGILVLVFGFVQMWLRANRSALLHDEPADAGWRMELHPLSLVPLPDPERAEETTSARPWTYAPDPAIKGVLSDTFEWHAAEDDTSVFADRTAAMRKGHE